GDFYNANFINAKIDMEKGEGPDIAAKYVVRAYPSYLFLNPKGNIVHRGIGSMDPEQFVVLGKIALDPQRNFAAIRSKYEADPSNADLVLLYCNELKKVYDNTYVAVAENYLNKLDESALLDRKNWMIMEGFVESLDSKSFLFLIKNQKKYEKNFGKEKVNKKIDAVVEAEVYKAFRAKDVDLLKTVAEKIKSMHLPNNDYYQALISLRISTINQDWNSYGESFIAMVSHNPDLDANTINSYAWNCYKFINDVSLLEKVAQIIGKTVDKHDYYALHDTYASLLYKAKKYEKALEEANKAIALARENNEDFSGTTELINDIRAAMGE
ncbi:MAG: hypothetical protein RQ866_02895, partial [Bacteroidales bacterium]|nr:hypothetical protein [Bacteroidales bacterium]